MTDGAFLCLTHICALYKWTHSVVLDSPFLDLLQLYMDPVEGNICW